MKRLVASVRGYLGVDFAVSRSRGRWVCSCEVDRLGRNPNLPCSHISALLRGSFVEDEEEYNRAPTVHGQRLVKFTAYGRRLAARALYHVWAVRALEKEETV